MSPMKLPVLLTLSLAAGCATDFSKRGTESEFAAVTSNEQKHAAEALRLDCSGLPEIAVPAGSTWTPAGRIPEGAVLRCTSHVIQIRSGHVHEAYLVADGSTLVGAYLPVLRRFFAADPELSTPWTTEDLQ